MPRRARRSSRRTSPPRRPGSRSCNALQAALAAEIRETRQRAQRHRRRPRRGQGKITKMQDADRGRPGPTTTALVAQLQVLDANAARSSKPRRPPRRSELAGRQSLLAERIRSAYDTDRTSLLETFLSGGTFTDMLAEMSYYIDVGEQDKALATQIAKDQETLAAIHQTVADTRARTNELRQETAAQKRALDQQPRRAQGGEGRRSRRSRSGRPRALAKQKAAYADLASATRPRPPRRWPRPRPPRSELPEPDRRAHPAAGGSGRHPVASTTARWPGRWAGTSPRSSAAPGSSGSRALGRLRPLPQRHRHRRAVRHAGPGVGRRDGRLRRLELRRRRRPGLDRGHRPLARRCRPGTPTCSRAARRDPAGQPRPSRARSSATRATPGNSTGRAPPLGGRAQRQLRQPAAVPVAPAACRRSGR